jgi:hypothetical protein
MHRACGNTGVVCYDGALDVGWNGYGVDDLGLDPTARVRVVVYSGFLDRKCERVLGASLEVVKEFSEKYSVRQKPLLKTKSISESVTFASNGKVCCTLQAE